MKIFRNPIFTFLLGIIIFAGINTYASIKAQADEIEYSSGVTVKDKIDDLYTKVNKVATQVATLTTQGASYTMQNDGYVIGTVTGHGTEGYGEVYFDGTTMAYAVGSNRTNQVSLYAQKNTVVSTRTPYGSYNLTVYEWR